MASIFGFLWKKRQLVHFKDEDFRAVGIVTDSICVSFDKATEMEERETVDASQNWESESESGCISNLGKWKWNDGSILKKVKVKVTVDAFQNWESESEGGSI